MCGWPTRKEYSVGARDGYVILDSDPHMMEPDDLWARYLGPTGPG